MLHKPIDDWVGALEKQIGDARQLSDQIVNSYRGQHCWTRESMTVRIPVLGFTRQIAPVSLISTYMYIARCENLPAPLSRISSKNNGTLSTGWTALRLTHSLAQLRLLSKYCLLKRYNYA